MEREAFPDFLNEFVAPWYRSLKNPSESQGDVLNVLLDGYRRTEYGRRHGSDDVNDLVAFRRSFPIASYEALRPYIERVIKGDYSSLLPEPVTRWVMTRGSTGVPKMIPCTETHLSQILTNGARAIINFAKRHSSLSVLEKKVLNLNFPAEVGTLPSGSQSYGYSSGTYAKLNPELGPAALVPRQEKIDSLGGGITKNDWERRFELVYREAASEDVGSSMGVTPVMVAFSRYLQKRHRKSPKDLWKMDALFSTSVPKIQSLYAPILKHQYGDVPVVEMYAASEGVFAQQLDDLPYVSPNYDNYLFEVKTWRGVKLLHEMKRNEWGRVIISTSLFPRYDIGDMVESLGKGYFRIFGRAKLLTVAEHLLFNAVTLRF